MSLLEVRPSVLIKGLQDGTSGPSVVHARSLTFGLVEAYWGALTGARPIRKLSEFGCEVSRAPALIRLQQLGSELAVLSPLDASYIIGRIYTALLPASYRSRHGIYFTPPSLTRRLMDLARASGVDLGTARVLDPACGGGAFLAPVTSAKLAELRDLAPSTVFDRIVSTVRGFELDPFSAWLSQVFLDAVTEPLCRESRKSLPVLVEVRDALKVRDEGSYDLVIGNPPYGRVQLDSDQREYYERTLYGHANLYGLFTDLALRLARSGGVIAYVTPTSFLAGQYFKNLRRILAREAAPKFLEIISDREGVFDDVLQETLLAVYRRAEPPSAGRVRRIRIQPPGGLEVDEVGELELPEPTTDPWLIAREPRQMARVRAARRQTTRLADIGYRVSTGPLVWNRHKGQLRKEPGERRFPLLWAEAVTAAGSFRFRAAKKNHEPYFEIRAGRDDWLLTRRPCVLLQRTTAKEQTRRLIAAELPAAFLDQHGAAVVENHLNMIWASEDPLVAPAVIASLLNSAVLDDLFRCISGSVAVSAFELEALPLPAPGSLMELASALENGATVDEVETLLERAYFDELAPVAG
jgi:adenine-specific DNA-methyltransferase